MSEPDSTEAQPTEPEITSVGTTARAIIENVEEVIVGNEETIEHVVTTILAGGHVLLEDVPGVGKTMLAKSIAKSFEGSFGRVQFTPDLLPADVTGVNVYNQESGSFEFRPGPIFGNVVLADEIDRAPPKTQSALLEAMEESQTTIDGETHALPEPFTVVATRNTVADGGAYELPVAELDRFTKRLDLGYPEENEEVELLGRMVGQHPVDQLESVASLDALRRAQSIVSEVTVSRELREYVTRLVRYTREHAQLGISPRGGIELLRVAQARGALDGRSYVIPDDVQYEAPVVFGHRLRTGENGGEEFVSQLLESVPVE